jgi:hypothetical protein
MTTVVLPAGDENTWLGAFGEVWFRTVCTVAACPAAKPDPDVVDCDFFVHDQSQETARVQVKSTMSPRITRAGYSFDLPIKTYDRLRVGNTRGYLALVVVHKAHPRWTGHVRMGSMVRATGYYAELTGLPAKPGQQTVSVSLPLANMLTPASVLGLF